MGAVQRFCDRAMLLERGRVVDIGEPSSIALQYNHLNFHHENDAIEASVSAPSRARECPVAEILNAWFQGPDREVIVTASQGEPCQIRMDVRFLSTVENPIFEVQLQSDSGQLAFATNSDAHEISAGRFERDSVASVRVEFENWLAPGRYRLVATVARAGLGADVFDRHARSSIIVIAERAGGGLADLPSTLAIERG
jgi:hypothetical protein